MKSNLLFNIILLCAIGSFAQNSVTINPDWMLTNITLYKSGGPIETSSLSIYNSGVVIKKQNSSQTLNAEQVAENNSFLLHPNHSNNKFNLRFDASILSQININIIELQGRKINQIKNLNSNYSVDTHDLSKGLYFINNNDLKNKLVTTKKLLI